jgi:hypothetical protein
LLAGDTMTGDTPKLRQMLPIGRIGTRRANVKTIALTVVRMGGHFGLQSFRTASAVIAPASAWSDTEAIPTGGWPCSLEHYHPAPTETAVISFSRAIRSSVCPDCHTLFLRLSRRVLRNPFVTFFEGTLPTFRNSAMCVRIPRLISGTQSA